MNNKGKAKVHPEIDHKPKPVAAAAGTGARPSHHNVHPHHPETDPHGHNNLEKADHHKINPAQGKSTPTPRPKVTDAPHHHQHEPEHDHHGRDHDHHHHEHDHEHYHEDDHGHHREIIHDHHHEEHQHHHDHDSHHHAHDQKHHEHDGHHKRISDESKPETSVNSHVSHHSPGPHHDEKHHPTSGRDPHKKDTHTKPAPHPGHPHGVGLPHAGRKSMSSSTLSGVSESSVSVSQKKTQSTQSFEVEKHSKSQNETSSTQSTIATTELKSGKSVTSKPVVKTTTSSTISANKSTPSHLSSEAKASQKSQKSAVGALPMTPSDTNSGVSEVNTEESLTRTTEAFKELNKIPQMKKFLADNISIVEQFRKHPDIALAVAKDRELARIVMEQPLFVQELIDTKSRIGINSLENSAPHPPTPTHSILSKNHYHYKNNDIKPTHVTVTTSTAPLPPAGQKSILSDKDKGHFGVAAEAETVTDTGTQTPFPLDGKIAHNSPSAIKYLAESTRIFLAHHVQVKERCWDNRRSFYDVMNEYGKPVYRLYEGKISKNITIRDIDGSELIVIQKKAKTFSKKTYIFCPPGCYIGCVLKKSSLCSKSTYHVQNESQETIINVMPKKNIRPKHSQSVFELSTEGDDELIGKITGEWQDFPQEVKLPNEIYGVNFPKELNCNVKILVLAAWFIIYTESYDGSLPVDTQMGKDRHPLADTAVRASADPSVPQGGHRGGYKRSSSITAKADIATRGSHNHAQ